MSLKSSFFVAVPLGMLLFLPSYTAQAALIDQVNQAFRSVHSRNPTVSEWTYWAGRVQRKEKTTYAALVGAMAYQNATNGGSPTAGVVTSVPAASSFRTGASSYPSSHNPNFLSAGTLIKQAGGSEVFYVQNGKKSWILPSVINRWLNENHFFKHDIILTLTASDFDRYPQTASVNPIYIGKVLQHANGDQYFIDDKLRKRKLSPSVRAAFKIPGGNLYPTSAVHLQEFKTGPALNNANFYPGGMVVYTGPYRGGRFWKIEEVAGGKLTKRLYQTDYLYEADGNPDESHRAPAVASILARHERGPNIEQYPDGWVVGLNNNIYVVQAGKLRLITTPDIFAAMGYKQKYVLTVFPEFLRRYPHGNSISAFKNIVAGASAATKGGPAPAPTTTSNLTRVRPHIRALINDINTIYLSVFDKDVTVSENKFWVDYVYNGEVNNKADLIATMQRTKITGQKPARTSRTATLSEDTLEQKWFPYLFYFTHQKEPAEDDKGYWYSRIQPGDRDSIEKLGGTIQWLKDTQGATRR
jgi:hypothetical protein